MGDKKTGKWVVVANEESDEKHQNIKGAEKPSEKGSVVTGNLPTDLRTAEGVENPFK